ncbi:unnamed protein product [Cylindrotheca closterium]|uniref:Peptidase M48 domain-containing protein n=1 Tax=Cylindrotheca closterium TaxID=2856 RepID=A0AAD2JIS5_9STRA|nr:unnamed protein product [Cylindrotheca closterium]
MFVLPRFIGAASRQCLSSTLTRRGRPRLVVSTRTTTIPKASFLSTSSSTRANIQPPHSNNSIPPYMIAMISLPLVGAGYLYVRYQDEVPLTKRQRWIATSTKWETQMGDQEFAKLKRQYKSEILPKDHRASVTVQRVGSRIAQAALEFSQEYNSIGNNNNTFVQPTFTVVRSDQANAFVLPGNHIFVFTGLFQYIQTEDELAAVLGHEMAHTLARHVGEKISSNLLVQLLGSLSLLVDPSGSLLSLIIPSASLLREMPNSRTQEFEADRIGMHLASRACFDPRAAQHFFKKMKQEEEKGKRSRNSRPPEFMSTHPSHDSRIDSMHGWLQETNPIYNREDGTVCRKMREDIAQSRRIAAQRHAARENQHQQQRVLA